MRVGLVGFAGSGKSTLFHLLTGYSVRSGQGSFGTGRRGRAGRPAARIPGLVALPQEGHSRPPSSFSTPPV